MKQMSIFLLLCVSRVFHLSISIPVFDRKPLIALLNRSHKFHFFQICQQIICAMKQYYYGITKTNQILGLDFSFIFVFHRFLCVRFLHNAEYCRLDQWLEKQSK